MGSSLCRIRAFDLIRHLHPNSLNYFVGNSNPFTIAIMCSKIPNGCSRELTSRLNEWGLTWTTALEILFPQHLTISTSAIQFFLSFIFSTWLDSFKLHSKDSGDRALQLKILTSTSIGLSNGNIHQGWSHSIHVGSIKGSDPSLRLTGAIRNITFQASSSSLSYQPYIMVGMALICTSISGDSTIIFSCQKIPQWHFGPASMVTTLDLCLCQSRPKWVNNNKKETI